MYAARRAPPGPPAWPRSGSTHHTRLGYSQGGALLDRHAHLPRLEVQDAAPRGVTRKRRRASSGPPARPSTGRAPGPARGRRRARRGRGPRTATCARDAVIAQGVLARAARAVLEVAGDDGRLGPLEIARPQLVAGGARSGLRPRRVGPRRRGAHVRARNPRFAPGRAGRRAEAQHRTGGHCLCRRAPHRVRRPSRAPRPARRRRASRPARP